MARVLARMTVTALTFTAKRRVTAPERRRVTVRRVLFRRVEQFRGESSPLIPEPCAEFRAFGSEDQRFIFCVSSSGGRPDRRRPLCPGRAGAGTCGVGRGGRTRQPAPPLPGEVDGTAQLAQESHCSQKRWTDVESEAIGQSGSGDRAWRFDEMNWDWLS